MCLGCSKDSPHHYVSIEYPQHFYTNFQVLIFPLSQSSISEVEF